ncbi:MAG: hypothetical protein AABZ14_03730, partial [Candidatus Margulisiibacteriota bacterium]
LVDRAGNVGVISQPIVVDMTPPSINLFSLDFATNNKGLRGDIDSHGDGVDPYYGYWDEPSVNIEVVSLSYAEDYRRSNDVFVKDYRYTHVPVMHDFGLGWVTTENNIGQSSRVFREIYVPEGNSQPIVVYVADLAGNVVSRQILVTVDQTVPAGFAQIVLDVDTDSQGD